MLDSEEREKVQRYIDLNNGWKWLAGVWLCTHYTLGCVTLFLSTVVAAHPFNDHFFLDVAPWLLALFTGLLTFFEPQQRANKYRRAWTLLSGVLFRYEVDHHTTPEDVMVAYQQGENIINNQPIDLPHPAEPTKALKKRRGTN